MSYIWVEHFNLPQITMKLCSKEGSSLCFWQIHLMMINCIWFLKDGISIHFIFVLNQRHLSENEHIFTFKMYLVTLHSVPQYLQARYETNLMKVLVLCFFFFKHMNLFWIITGLLVNWISVYSIEEFKTSSLCPVSSK